MARKDCDHIGTLGSFVGSLGEVQLKPNIALGIFPLTLSFKIMLFSCSFLWWADTLFVHTHRNSGERCMQMQSLCCHRCDIAAKRENFFWGASVQLGWGQLSLMTTFNTLSFPYSPTDGGRGSPFPAQAFRLEQLYFL